MYSYEIALEHSVDNCREVLKLDWWFLSIATSISLILARTKINTLQKLYYRELIKFYIFEDVNDSIKRLLCKLKDKFLNNLRYLGFYIGNESLI